MNYQDIQGRHAIDFHIRAKSESVLDELAFVHLVQMKFSGNLHACGRFWSLEGGRKQTFYSIELTFKDFDAFDGARYHCRRNVTGDGDVKSDYRGALDAADRDRIMAKKIRAKVRKTSYSN